jgi:hypothetical protein
MAQAEVTFSRDERYEGERPEQPYRHYDILYTDGTGRVRSLGFCRQAAPGWQWCLTMREGGIAGAGRCFDYLSEARAMARASMGLPPG